jgi:SagB-type dehydrogenase family enzyme
MSTIDHLPRATGAAADAPAGAAPGGDALATVLRYHHETKHHFFRYARSPGRLDWSSQPDPFRRYEGCPLIALPQPAPDESLSAPRYGELYGGDMIPSAAFSAASLSRFLDCSLAVSAWKQAGDVRWALRVNPSSGNLHPTEAYLLMNAANGWPPAPGLYHYAPREHALELRTEWPSRDMRRLVAAFPAPAFLLGFTSVHWREAWKYGERAYRYVQHDLGHALGCARIAAQLMGWRLLLLAGTSDATIGSLLGTDRPGDFIGVEREQPGCLAVVWPAEAAGPAPSPAMALPLFIAQDALHPLPLRRWHGRAGRLSRGHPVRWELITKVTAACAQAGTQDTAGLEAAGKRVEVQPDAVPAAGGPGAVQVIRQRRSAVAFDGTTGLGAEAFFGMLARVMPRPDLAVCQRPMPWDALPWAPAVHLALFVHRVHGLPSGLYLLAREASAIGPLRRAMLPRFTWEAPEHCPPALPLFLLQRADVRALATQLCCAQGIGGDGAFSVAMLAEFEPALNRHGPACYRRLFWEAGVIGQVLYLEAEAVGLRATGIGCFFDDPVHEVMGFADGSFQSLYHLAVGGPVDDPRLAGPVSSAALSANPGPNVRENERSPS